MFTIRWVLVTTVVFGFVVALGTLVSPLGSRAGDLGDDHGAATLEKLKSLAGNWYDSTDTSSLVSQIQVVSGGTAVMETIFPGSDKEMISIYHLDGDQLLMTHYCMLGNQPRFKASVTGSIIRFDFAGGTNMNPEVDLHIHQGEVELLSENQLRSKWTPFQNNEAVEPHEFELVRLAKPDTSANARGPAACCAGAAK